LRLVVECEELEQPVYVDKDMWEKIVLNLLSNALKFTMHGEIRVTIKTVSSMLARQ
jgi:signal transduction histidine kinase